MVEAQPIHVLVIGESSDNDAVAVCAAERSGGIHIARTDRVDDAVVRIGVEAFDAVVVDESTMRVPAIDIARKLRDRAPALPIVVLTDRENEAPQDADPESIDDVLRKDRLDPRTLGIALRFTIERSARQHAERALRDAHSELRTAWQIQQSLMPDTAPRLPGYDIAGACQPAGAVGGDYFDYLPLSGGRLGIVIGDASGHGIGPALLMAQSRAALRSLTLTHDQPGAILSAANRVLSDGMLDKHFVTLSLLAIDPAQGRIQYASAGHPGGLVFDAHGRFLRELGSTGFPLGVMAETPIPDSDTIRVEPGQIVVMFTDGITEATPKRGAQQFGMDRLIAEIEELHPMAASDIVDSVYYRVLKHCHPRTPGDDATIVVIKVEDDGGE